MLALPFLIFGIVLVAFGLMDRRRALAAQGWPTVWGVVRAGEVVHEAAGTHGHAGDTYHADVRYDYVVEGLDYHGTCISTGMTDEATPGYPDALVLRYAPGNVTRVRHDPVDHARSVLEVHPRGAGLAAVFLGAVCCFGGVIAALVAVLAQ